MIDRPLTLMAVHAHPDDEATFTAGILARYAAEGIRTVVVTCTDGSCGDGPGGVKPGEPGHDPTAVAALRRGELEASCRVLKVGELELLGYLDSGMMGWSQNSAPGSFWAAPVEDGAARLAELMRLYRPDVVVTYDADGYYGHPDHIQAHRITVAALELSAVPAKLYWATVSHGAVEMLDAMVRELRGEPSAEAETAAEAAEPVRLGAGEGEITARVDVSGYCDRMFEALSMHESQSPNISLLAVGPERYARLSGTESYIRADAGAARDARGRDAQDAEPETDLFAGLR
jgi:LmbE family N-acetylglucosaminyl deacetylase